MGAQCKSCSEYCKKGLSNQRGAQPIEQIIFQQESEKIQLYKEDLSYKSQDSQKYGTLKRTEQFEKKGSLKSEKSEQVQKQQNTKKEQQNQNQKTYNNKECINPDNYNSSSQQKNNQQSQKEPVKQQSLEVSRNLFKSPVKQVQKDILEEQRDIQCNIEGHLKSRILKLCIHKTCSESQRFICIQCENEQLHLQDPEFSIDKIIDLENMTKMIQDNSIQIKNLNSIFHDQLLQITAQFERVFIEILKTYQNLLNLFRITDLCYDKNFSLLLKDKKALIEIVNDQKLIKLLTVAPNDIFLEKHGSVLQCFQKVCSYINEFQEISHKTKKLEEQFKKLLQNGQNFEKQEDPCQSISNSLIKQNQQSQERESEFLDSQNIIIQQGTQLINDGYTQYKLKCYQDSQKLFSQALENSKQNEQHIIYYYIGKCLLKQFQLKKKHINDEQQILKEKQLIMEKFDQTKRLCPSFKKVYQQIYKLHSLWGDQEQATLFMVKEKQINNDYKLFLKLGNIYKYLKQYETALKYYDKCVEQQKDNLEALYNMGNIFFMIGNYDECIKIMQQIIKVNNEYSDAYLLLSDSLLKQDNWRDALNILFKRKKSFKLDQRFLDKIKFIYDQNFHMKINSEIKI